MTQQKEKVKRHDNEELGTMDFWAQFYIFAKHFLKYFFEKKSFFKLKKKPIQEKKTLAKSKL